MVFKTLDIEKDIVEQGYAEHSYDLVVASLVLHATADLKRTLANTRRLLKPGGYLIIQEVSNNDVSRVGFLMCALPGWWLGQNDGRKLSPCVSTLEWHKLLLESNFSGVESCTPDCDATPYPLAVIVSQAIDDQVAFLREPLSSASTQVMDHHEWDLILIGGHSLTSPHIIERIVEIAQPLKIRHVIFNDLGDVDTTQISTKTAILCLTELDEPVFEGLTERTLEGMKRLFETQRTILWITQGCRSDNPYMSMSVGLGRSLVLENPDLVLQFLDLEIGVRSNPRQLLEALLRLRQGDVWEKEGKLDNMLWTTEHELAYYDGELTVSRVANEAILNDRYNASKRTILHSKSPTAVPLVLDLDISSNYTLAVDEPLAAAMLNPQRELGVSDSLIKVSHSLLNPVDRTPLPSYLVLGVNTATDKSVVAISTQNSSFVLASPGNAFEINLPVGENSRFMSRLNTQLVMGRILSTCPRDTSLLIHEPSLELASGIAELASEANITVSFITTSPTLKGGAWTRIDQYSPRRVIQALVPPNLSLFIDCAAEGQARRTGSLIASCLPQSCLKTTFAELCTAQQVQNSVADLIQKLDGLIQRSLNENPRSEDLRDFPSISLSQLVGQPAIDLSEGAIVDWRDATPIPIPTSTIDGQINFKNDKTYILFGLTSDLAQSICDWMATHGARNIILTSRSPKIDGEWVQSLAEVGVRLEFFAKYVSPVSATPSSTRIDKLPVTLRTRDRLRHLSTTYEKLSLPSRVSPMVQWSLTIFHSSRCLSTR